MSEEMAQKLARLAELASTPERRVSPMQIAAPLLEDAMEQSPSEPTYPGYSRVTGDDLMRGGIITRVSRQGEPCEPGMPSRPPDLSIHRSP
jgi:hypothetical protein